MDRAACQGQLLMACFADFYAEMAQLRLAIARGRLAAYLAEGEAVSFAGPGELAAAVADRLGSRLERQAKAIKDGGNDADIKLHRQAQYVMAALVDELLLLDTRWTGATAWRHELLERRFFDTSSAGRDFFARLEQLLQLRGRSAMLTDLGAVYLLALQLGFQGMYRSRQGAAVIARYKARLLRFIGWSGGDEEGLMFPAAYRHQISHASERRVAPLSRWLSIATVMLLGYVLASSLVWLQAIRGFDRLFGSG